MHLRAMRESARMTQAQLAERLGRSQPSIAGIESGRQGITLAQAHDWARVCGGVLVVGAEVATRLPDREAALVALLVERLRSGLHPENIRTLELILNGWPSWNRGSIEALSVEIKDVLNRLEDVKTRLT